MRFAVRVTTPLERLAERMRAAARAGRRGEAAQATPLPSTSNIRDPIEIAALTRFDDPIRDET